MKKELIKKVLAYYVAYALVFFVVYVLFHLCFGDELDVSGTIFTSLFFALFMTIFNYRKIKKALCLTLLLSSATAIYAQVPTGYYDSCEGKSGKSLLTALHNTISSHTTVSYDGLWEVYKTSDIRPNGKVWDMYSTKEWTVGAEHCGNYSAVGDCINREHSVPQSWFNSASPMKSDAFHVYPTDGKVNGQRSNYPYGECANGTSLPSNGGVKPLGRTGSCTFSGYSGTVFEPDDEYKGDFARTYFYMATCYNDRISSWSGAIIAGNSYPCYSSWAVNLFLKWHRQDPVSQKEIDRNNAIYVHQKNRNPYIDYPELAEHVWGDKTSEAWSSESTIDPAISTPVDGSYIDMGVTAIGVTRSIGITVKSIALTEDVSVSVSGNGFSVSETTLPASAVNSENGTPLTIYYTSETAGDSTGKLSLTSGDCTATVNLSAKALNGLPAGEATDVTTSSFVAHWTNIDGNDASMQYSVNLYCNGLPVDGYPVKVLASAEEYIINGLEPETTYSYTVSSPTHVSNTVTVTTAAPIPMIQFYYTGGLSIETQPGTPSDAVEIEIYTEYIENNITVSVTAPFEISTDKGTWTQTLSLLPEEDRFYLRINPPTEGTFTTQVNAVSGNCSAETLEFSAIVASTPAFLEDFEQDATGMSSYNPTTLYNGTASIWKFSDAGMWSSDTSLDEQSVRFGKTANSYIEMTEDKKLGAGTVSFHIAKWKNDSEAAMDVEYSTDAGTTWNVAGSVSISSTSYTPFNVVVNVAGNIRLRFQQTAGKRFNIDNIEISNYKTSGLAENSVADEWDAYCSGGQLVIESDGTESIKVYSIDGVMHYNSIPVCGATRLTLTRGLYIVSGDNCSRRVLVKE